MYLAALLLILKVLKSNVNLNQLARDMECFSGAEIEAVVVDALGFALERASATTSAGTNIYRALGKDFAGSPRSSTNTKEEGLELEDIQLNADDFEKAVRAAEPTFGNNLLFSSNRISADKSESTSVDTWVSQAFLKQNNGQHLHIPTQEQPNLWLDRSEVNGRYEKLYKRLALTINSAALRIQHARRLITSSYNKKASDNENRQNALTLWNQQPPTSMVICGQIGTGKRSLLRHALSVSAFARANDDDCTEFCCDTYIDECPTNSQKLLLNDPFCTRCV